jgi:hypothetical protein
LSDGSGPHITFYEEATEALVSFVDAPTPPRVGERVWLWRHGTREFGCWEVVMVAWTYDAPNREASDQMVTMVDAVVRPSEGLFR